tara:strand:- start:244072 stop:246516 length:2445 start_codon:yes stop_codon:yes gene_type:complete
MTYSQSIQQPAMEMVPGETQRPPDAANLISALWRYRWAAILPMAIGIILGFLVFLKTEETFQSTTRLMVESDSTAILDSVTGEMVGGVPSIEVIESQLFSDEVLMTAYNDPRVQVFHEEEFPEGPEQFMSVVVGGKALTLEPEVTDLKTGSAIVTLMHFESTNPELCQNAVKAFSDALQVFYNKKYSGTRSELIKYMQVATEKLHPKLEALESQYDAFRRDAPLVWDSEGAAINPHRESQLKLLGKRAEMNELKRRMATEYAAIKSITETSQDPRIAISVISQLLDRRITLPQTHNPSMGIGASDQLLGELSVDESLVPTLVERMKLASEFGEGHPTVKQLDLQIDVMRRELKDLMNDRVDRIGELIDNDERDLQNASQVLDAISKGVAAEVAVLERQEKDLDELIAQEAAGASRLAKYEQQNNSMVRQIERTSELMEQLEEQVARVNLTEDESKTRVLELTAASPARRVGPVWIKMLGLGGLIGLALGSGLALLLEKNANTFRDADEVCRLLGTTILTHIPFYKGRVRKERKGVLNPYKDLDPYLAVVHAPSSVAAEAMRSCRTAIFFELASISGGKVIQVTSPLPGDGKSTVAGNLACSIAQSGKRTLLVDCDLRRPQLTENFGMDDDMGLTNVLNGECDPADAMHQTPVPSLQVMPSGPIPANPAEALTLTEMGELLDHMRDEYDYVILDTPPLLVVTDPSIIASMADGVVTTLRIRRKSKPNAKEAMNILRAVGAKSLGVIINNSDESTSSDGYRGYGYYRHGRKTSRYYRQADSGMNQDAIVVSGRGVAPLPKPAKAQLVGPTDENTEG